jgi:hypothetical protein
MMPLAGGWEFGSSVNPITTRGQIMPTTLLLAHPDLKTHWHLCEYDTSQNDPIEIQKDVKGLNLFSCFSPQQSVKGYDQH